MVRRIAIPVEYGRLCTHFGHCKFFYIASVNEKSVISEEIIKPPKHEPGLYPAWVSEKGATIVIAGGMGEKAQELFRKENIELFIGAEFKDPKDLVIDFLTGNLKTGSNSCNHS
ncbi:MAG: NifB/NifX family molybdenum-iron cluster-binding protein [Bacteroidales bacterium]|nr:NifB/NifX family molybdenum-iron cluster-binding protein [Bacteroidales bacterium]